MRERGICRGRAAAVLFLTALAAAPTVAAQSLAPDEIIRRAEQSVYPDVFLMHATLQTLRSGGSPTTMEMTISYKRGVGARIELLSPARSRGIRFLQKEGALWMFNPLAGTSQAIRLSPKAAFQGSVFSNRDVGDPQYSLDYEMRLVGTESFDHPQAGRVDALVLEGTARSERSAYSKVRLWVRAGDYLLLQSEYYAKSGLLFRRAIFEGIRQMSGRERPTVVRMTSLDQPGRGSVLTISRLEEQPDLPDSLFTLSALTR